MSLAIEVPVLRLWYCVSTPLTWVVEDETTGQFWFVPAAQNGWDRRTPYRGHREALQECGGYCFMALGVPMRRPWPDVCRGDGHN